QMPGDKGRIRTKTAWDADSLRGDYADLLILDEYATMDPSAWELVGAPMLLDNDGDAVFIGTPK
ncbi:MAG: terminase, partial [Anaerolineae bacterium]|nr:terminase [Anaerolineae bacterium]